MDAQQFRSTWAGSFYVCSMRFEHAGQGCCCQIAFNFVMSFKEQERISDWVFKQRSRRVSWEAITRLLQIQYQERGDVVHRVLQWSNATKKIA